MYPKWFCKTITLYCRYEDTTTKRVSWYRYVIDGAYYKNISSSALIGNVRISTESTVCRIRAGSRYLSPNAWLVCENTNKIQSYTLKNGDIVVLGSVSDSIDEYTAGIRSSDLIAKYRAQGAIKINKVSVNTELGSSHFRVEGN
ncbi:hypothetical protein SDC9_103595 [bioreactor metagenome]|uniref:Uncharacterized protein n=1 Tax=bioreactor metagenome TaxID=1076179 RepID=A0A645AUI1_9ZZZZ|nr:hypothetical protein [Oscillospiraceae bacterium]